MSSIPTIAESRAASVEKVPISRATTQFDNAEGAMNLIEQVAFTVPADLSPALTGGALKGRVTTYLCFKALTSGDYPTAVVGDMVRVLKIDSSQSTSVIYDAQIWLLTSNGWVQLTAATPIATKVPVACTDAAQTPTGAAVVAAETFYMTPTANRNFTLPTATTLYAAVSGATTNAQILVRISNAAAATYNIVVVPDASITNRGSAASLTVSPGTSATFVLNFSSATTADLIRV